jgi:ParB-like chromosome segregation protein Spo0J
MKLTEITVDSSLQGRFKLNQEVIDEYSETIREGGKLPAIKVFRIGSSHYLVDGWHRYFAHKKAGLADIEVDVVDGNMREATLYAIGANDDHGLRRNNEDKRKAVMMLLDDVEWSEWNDSEIAKAARVSRMTVSRIKSSLGIKKDEVKIIRDGKEIKLNTANIGSKNEQKFLGVQPIQEENFENEITAEMEAIVEENETLTRRLAVAAMEASDEEKRMAEDQLVQMASEIKTLTATLNSSQTQANTYMNQTAELKDQVKYWKRRAEKAEKQLDEFKKLGVSV